MIKIERAVISLLTIFLAVILVNTGCGTTKPAVTTGSIDINDTNTTTVVDYIPTPEIDQNNTEVDPGVEVVIDEPEPYEGISDLLIVGDTEQAIKRFEDASKEDPESTETAVLYSSLLLSAGKIEDAEGVINSALENDPENTDAIYNLAMIEGVKGNYKEKEALLEDIVEKDPEHSNAHSALGEIYLRRKAVTKAKEAFTTSLEHDSENIVALIGMGNVLMRQGEWEESIEVLDKAIEVEPRYSFSYVDRSRAKMANEEYIAAEIDITTAIELDPGYSWSYLDRGRIRVQLRQRSKALEDFDTAIALDPDNFLSYVYRAGIYDEMGNVDSALEDYRKIVALKPEYYFAYVPLGIHLYMREEWEECAEMFKQAFEYDKQQYNYPLLAALAMKWQGDQAGASKYLQSVTQFLPRESPFYEMARYYITPASPLYAQTVVNKIKDDVLRNRMLFYLGAQDHINGLESVAVQYYTEIKEAEMRGYPEFMLAEHEIKDLE